MLGLTGFGKRGLPEYCETVADDTVCVRLGQLPRPDFWLLHYRSHDAPQSILFTCLVTIVRWRCAPSQTGRVNQCRSLTPATQDSI